MPDAFNPIKTPPFSRRAARIIAAAHQIMVETGTEDVTRKSVAERAGMKPAEVSREFPTRAALMQALKSIKAE